MLSLHFLMISRNFTFFMNFQAQKMAEAGIPVTNNWRRISYFHCSLLGYFLGLLTATVSSEVSIEIYFSE